MSIRLIATAAAVLPAAVVMGSVYSDPQGDIATGNPNLDIVSVSVSNDANDVTMSLTLDNLGSDNWGKYMVFLDWKAGGSNDNDNPWFRDVGGLGGMDGFLGTWLDGTAGSQFSENDGSGWSDSLIDVTMAVDWGSSTITWTYVGLTTALLADGATGFDFEIGTTGGNHGDPAIDLVGGEDTQPGWGGGSTSTDLSHYDLTDIPAPGALALLGLAGLATRRRRR